MRLLLIIAVVAVSAYAGRAQVPREVQSYIQTHLQGWTIVDTADYDRTWWSFYDRKQIPFFITVDLNDDQTEDHAILIKRSDMIRLVILFRTGNSFTHRITDDFKVGAGKLKYGLAVEPAGQIDVLEPKEATLILRSNAITLMELEERARIWYWADRTIKTFLCKRIGL
jgi:hypothetical protein